jgi:hypothetical protein
MIDIDVRGPQTAQKQPTSSKITSSTSPTAMHRRPPRGIVAHRDASSSTAVTLHRRPPRCIVVHRSDQQHVYAFYEWIITLYFLKTSTPPPLPPTSTHHLPLPLLPSNEPVLVITFVRFGAPSQRCRICLQPHGFRGR